MDHRESHIVPKLPKPIRLQDYGAGIFNLIPTKSALKKAIKKKYILVNKSIASTATLLRGGESIELSISDKATPVNRLVFPLDVLLEDDYLAIIHKPAGILVSGNSFKTIANALSQNVKRSNLPDATIPQPVHRLDYATTGLLLVGKTSSSIQIINKMFENKEIKKSYLAIAIGEIPEEGSITAPIDGKKSHSSYSLINTVHSKRFGKLNLVELSPKTGRRHQLRKHLSEIGNPILGDKDYGKEGLILKGKGLYLHAHSLKFTHPISKKEVYLKSDIPVKFQKIFPVSS
jgi:23S rRNA pseudouridine1911/1915/1917 synthase